jgi:hypothetical protein
VPLDGAPAATEQASQAPPLQAEPQHTPSTQKPLAQSFVLVQGVPFACPCLMQVPEVHSKPAAQSAFDPHEVGHEAVDPEQR